jgi:hypothetical protein
MSESVLDGPDQTAGPVNIGGDGGVLCMSGVMSAGYVTLFYRPEGSETFFPCDEIWHEQFTDVVCNVEGDGYGLCAEIAVPRGGQVKLMSALDFVGALTVFLGSKN